MVRLLHAACSMAMLLGAACVEDGAYVRIDSEKVMYDGEPYGDFVLLGDAVRRCMKSDRNDLPRLVLVDGLFECHTTRGWRTVFGCSGTDEVFLVASVVRDTSGQLWSHELTHYFGAQRENDPCGAIALQNFSLDLPDAGL